LSRLREQEEHPVPPRQSETLTEAELRIMNVLWVRGSGTVQQVLDSITERPPLAYNSVLTTIRVLEKKGYLEHLKDGRAHVYTPLVAQKDATRSEIRHLVSRFFKNSHEQLVLNLLEDQGIEPEELRRLRQMLIQNQPVQNDTVQNDTVHRNTVQNDSVRKEAK
jgi:predicted transcriptional regulator